MDAFEGGTGAKLGRIAVIVAGVCALVAIALSAVAIWLQLKNYRKPLLQRYVVRILLMVPIYAISSWVSLRSIKASYWVDPIRDIYEAFTIYTFFQLLVNFLGGERSLIIMTHGRAPKEHLWPFNYMFGKVDISDPHTFLAIKRGILQYAWLKPVLGLATVIMKATHTYQEGYVGLKSGYFWSGIIYNISVSLSLYSLAMFWLCMNHDLTPFRPVPKFLCVKLIIFASYWQGFFLSILVWLGIIHDVGYYTPDNIAAAIQDALICFELPGFAIAHWYAFSWKDYADRTIHAARMPVMYAARDAFGIRDLIEDSKITFRGKGYEYRLFDPSEDILAHPESGARAARMMEGMRFEKNGKGKYWLPKPNSKPGSLNAPGPSSETQTMRPNQAHRSYGTRKDGWELEGTEIDQDDEELFDDARKLEHGDYNYPVITAHEPFGDHRCRHNHSNAMLTTATNQAVLNPKKIKKKAKGKAKQKIADAVDGAEEAVEPLLSRHNSSNSASSQSSHFSDRSGVVDLIVEDKDAEERERVRARKEGGPGFNAVEPKVFVRKWPPEQEGEVIREGFVPSSADEHPIIPDPDKVAQNAAFKLSDDEDDNESPSKSVDFSAAVEDHWKQSEESESKPSKKLSYGDLREDGVWER